MTDTNGKKDDVLEPGDDGLDLDPITGEAILGPAPDEEYDLDGDA